MKEQFAPYLDSVLPSIFSMATLKPEMGISGTTDLHDLNDVLSEVTPDKKSTAVSSNVNTDELEEKDVAIQMLTVFIDELGAAFIKYVQPTSEILLSMLNYRSNDSIRSSCASALPGLIKCVKDAQGVTQELHNLAKQF